MVLAKGRQHSGKPFWAYMCVKSNMAKAFREAQQRGELQMEDYGTVLEWGEGDTPPSDVQDRMRRDFGMRADYEDMLIKASKLFA